MLTRLSYPVEAVQLIGRRGSDAAKRYIQDTPLSCNFSPGPSSQTVATRATTEKAIKNMVKLRLQEVLDQEPDHQRDPHPGHTRVLR